MKKIDFKKTSKHIVHALKNIGSDADKDWRVFFLLFLVIFLISVAVHVQIYLNVESAKEDGASLEAKRTELIDSKALSDLLSKYDVRAGDYQKISSDTSVLVDPSH